MSWRVKDIDEERHIQDRVGQGKWRIKVNENKFWEISPDEGKTLIYTVCSFFSLVFLSLLISIFLWFASSFSLSSLLFYSLPLNFPSLYLFIQVPLLSLFFTLFKTMTWQGVPDRYVPKQKVSDVAYHGHWTDNVQCRDASHRQCVPWTMSPYTKRPLDDALHVHGVPDRSVLTLECIGVLLT